MRHGAGGHDPAAKMMLNDYVWQRLSWRKHFVGRCVVDRLVAEAMHTPIQYGAACEEAAAHAITERVKAETQSLGLAVLSILLPIVAREVVRLVLAWLASSQPTGPSSLPRVHG